MGRILIPLASSVALVCASLASASCERAGHPAGPANDAGDSARVGDAGADGAGTSDGAQPECGIAKGSHPVGSFVVEVRDGGLRVKHSAAGSHVLLDTAAGSWLDASSSTLDVEEQQGSFTVEDQVGTTDSSPVWDGCSAGGATLVLHGHFDQPLPRSGSVAFVLAFQALSEGRLRFVLSLSDPARNRIRLSLASSPDERIYGMGEQFPHATLDLKGRAIPVLVQEGGIGRGEPVVTPAADVLSPGSGGSESSTYFAMPHFITSSNRSMLLEDTEYAVFDFTAADATTVTLHAREMHGQILLGQSPLELIERLTEVTGRTPPPPEWLDQGAVVALARPDSDVAPLVDLLGSSGAELSAVWNQTWSGVAKSFVGEQVVWNWVLDDVRHPGWQQTVSALGSQGIRTLCYVNPMFRDVSEGLPDGKRNLFAEGMENGYFVTHEDGSVYLLKVTALDVALLDLSNAEARTWMKEIMKQEMATHASCSGWMADFAEALPFDAVLQSGEDAASWHNRFPVEWVRLNREAVEEMGKSGDFLVFNRSGHLRTPGVSLMVWEGDQLTTWDDFDGMGSALRGLVGSGFSGIALNHSDTGGYTSLAAVGTGYVRSAELLRRWTEMNAFTALLRTHEGNQPGSTLQVYTDEPARAHFARMTKVYKALAPYRRKLYAEAADKGWPVVRHLAMHYAGDHEAWKADDEFLLGAEILVAPARTPCADPAACTVDVPVYFPAGGWVHLWTGKEYGAADKGSWADVPAPLGEPPAFYRTGSTEGAALVDRLEQAGVL